MTRLRARAVLAAAVCVLAAAPPASARAPSPATDLPGKPHGYSVSAQEALRSAAADPNVAAAARDEELAPRLEAKPPEKWQIGYFAGDQEVVQVHVDSQTGRVLESWTGDQVAWQMARGYEGQFGHALNAWYVWIPLALVFLLGLLDLRRPWKLVHLDLLVLLAFGVSHALFNRGEIDLSVPLAYPPLLYLLARMAHVGFRGATGGLRPSAPVWLLAVACVFLICFRATLNVADSGVIDVGYAGVIGAERITAGEPLYGEHVFPADNPTGDTYGPANYYAYVPFETVLPWSGEWDSLPAAHAAAIFFDLLAVAGLFVLGIRLRPGRPAAGQAAGVVLAFAWLAYPYTAFALQANSNDALVGATVIWAIVLAASPVARGTLAAVAGLTKFAPLALAPLLIAGPTGLGAARPGTRPSLGGPLIGLAAFCAAAGLLLAHPAIDPGLATMWERTVASQLDRESPFSVWGQTTGTEWLQRGVLLATAGLAVLTAFRPRRRPPAQLAALAAAILIALQLAVDHWFYLYLPWFAGLVFAAGAGQRERPVNRRDSPPGSLPGRRAATP